MLAAWHCCNLHLADSLRAVPWEMILQMLFVLIPLKKALTLVIFKGFLSLLPLAYPLKTVVKEKRNDRSLLADGKGIHVFSEAWWSKTVSSVPSPLLRAGGKGIGMLCSWEGDTCFGCNGSVLENKGRNSDCAVNMWRWEWLGRISTFQSFGCLCQEAD